MSEGLQNKLKSLAAGHGSPAAVRAYTILFTLVLTAVFAIAVSALHVALKEKKLQNEKIGFQRVVLKLSGVLTPETKISDSEITARYEQDILQVESTSAQMVDVDGKTKPYVYYKRKGGSSVCVFPAWGKGFWGPIHGLVAVDTATGKITDIDFIRHEETPGLGGRISEEEVRARFRGKDYTKPFDDGRRIRVMRGGAVDAARDVDAITGASATSAAVEKLLNDSITLFLDVTSHASKGDAK